MSQQDIIDVLKKSKKPISADEISKMVEINKCRVFILIKNLLEYNEIKSIEITREQAMKYYHCKRRMRLYYI